MIFLGNDPTDVDIQIIIAIRIWMESALVAGPIPVGRVDIQGKRILMKASSEIRVPYNPVEPDYSHN